MRNAEIDSQLRDWFEKMMKVYSNLSFKFEYSERRQVYLVSAIVDLDEETYEHYCSDSMVFEDQLANRYGDDTPLFTDNEELFELSSNAYVVAPYVEAAEKEMRNTKVQYVTTPASAYDIDDLFIVTSEPLHSRTMNQSRYWGEEHHQNTYLLAA